MIKEAGATLINSVKALADYGLVVWQEAWAKDKEDDYHRIEELNYCPFCKKHGLNIVPHVIESHPELTWEGKKE